MKPVNNKSLLHFLFNQMEKLDKKEISVAQAKAQASIAKEVNSLMRYELERAKTKMELDKYKRQSGVEIENRELEAINF